jgi:hypothetical protein
VSLSRLSRSLLGRLPRSAPIPTMTWLNKINPTPTFPAYTGPYKVGSVDVELPTSQLESPGRSDSPSTNLATVSFRVFYPARPESKQKGTRWIQSPQKDVVSAYAKFLGAGNAMAGLFAYVRISMNQELWLTSEQDTSTTTILCHHSRSLKCRCARATYQNETLARHGLLPWPRRL